MGIRIASTWATPPPLSEGETADDEGRYRGRDEAEDSQGDVGSGETGETRTAGLVVDSAGFLHLSDTQWSKYRRLIGMGLNTLEISVEEAKAAPKVEDIDPFYFVRESFVDGWEYGEKVADLSCRDRLSERIIPNLLARDTNGLEYSATLQDDTLLRSMRCGEFAPDRTVYGLFRNPDSVSAQWKQIPLGYRLKFTFAPSGCENLENIRMGLYVFAGKESDIQPPLFASARSGLPAGNVYFKTLTLPNIDVPKFDSAQLPNMAATEVTGFNPAWFERMWLETTVDLFERMESPGEQLISKQQLYVKFKGGKPLLIGDADGSTQYDHTTLSRVDIIDPDGDGEPDFLVETGYGEVYLLRTFRGAIRGRIQVQLRRFAWAILLLLGMQAVIGCKDTKSKAAEPRAAGARPLADSAPAPGIPALNPEATEPPPVPGDSGLETGATEHGDSALIVYFADTFSDEGDANQTQSSLSCRDEILRRVGPKNDSTPGRYRSRLSKATLLQKGGCLEFLPPRNQYALFLRPDSVSAFWKPVDPDIEIEASIKDVVCDQGKYTHLDFSISLPGGRDTSFILFASTDIPRSQDPVPWSEWKWTGGYESFPKLDSARLPRIDTLRLVGFGKTWFPEVWLESRYAWGGGSEEVKRVVREQVALKARLPNGVTLVIASESADSGYSYGDAEIRSVKATDLDGDGNPEFILELSDGSQVLVGVRGGAVDRVITLERGSDRMLSGC